MTGSLEEELNKAQKKAEEEAKTKQEKPSPLPPSARPVKTEPKPAPGVSAPKSDQPSEQPQSPLVDKPKRKPPEPEPASHYLITSGLLVENDRVLWPRQVVRFSRSFCGHAATLAYYRWQVVVRPDDIEDAEDSEEVRKRRFTAKYRVNPVKYNEGILTHYLSRLTVTRPDGYAGFTGVSLMKSQSFTMGEAFQLCAKMRPDPLLQHLPEAERDFTEDMRFILPVFYLALARTDSSEIEKELAANPKTLLREVFDVHERRWKWMYQLGEVDSTSPIVMSEPPTWLREHARALHYKFANDYAVSDIYIGGCGLELTDLPVDIKTPRISREDRYSRTLGEPLQELDRIFDKDSGSDYRLKPVVFPLSGERSMGVEIQTIVNGRGTEMVKRIRHRVP